MGEERNYEGVRIASSSSIEIDFYYAGRRWRERIKLQPIPANLKRAAQHRAAILHAIENGTFDYPTTFPNSKNAEKFARPKNAQSVENFLDETSRHASSCSLRMRRDQMDKEWYEDGQRA